MGTYSLRFLLCLSTLLPSPLLRAQGYYDSLAKLQSLKNKNGRSVAYYSKGYDVRVQTIQRSIDACSGFYEKEFPGTKFAVKLFVLGREDWAGNPYGLPYGMPLADANNILIGADKKAVGALYGANDVLPDSVVSDFDNIALHELGHVFFNMKRTNIQHKWANEFMASYFAICYLQGAHVMQNEFPKIDQPGYYPQYKTLAEFDSLYLNVGPQNYGWYQSKFIALGEKLYPQLKTKLIEEFIREYSQNKDVSDPIALIRKLAPTEMNTWLKEMQ